MAAHVTLQGFGSFGGIENICNRRRLRLRVAMLRPTISETDLMGLENVAGGKAEAKI